MERRERTSHQARVRACRQPLFSFSNPSSSFSLTKTHMLVVHWIHGMTAASAMAMKKRQAA